MNEPTKRSKTARALAVYGGYKQRRTFDFEQTSSAIKPFNPPAADDAGYVEAERLRPARPPSIESDVVVPFGQALAAGFIASCVGAYAAAFAESLAWHFACISGLVVSGFWFILAVGWARKTSWISESIYQGSNDTPPAPPPPQAMTLEVTERAESGNFRKMNRHQLPAELSDKIPKFAAGVVNGRGLAVDTWTGKTGLFSRAEFSALMAALQQSDLVTWKNENAKGQGRELTQAGIEAMRQLQD